MLVKRKVYTKGIERVDAALRAARIVPLMRRIGSKFNSTAEVKVLKQLWLPFLPIRMRGG